MKYLLAFLTITSSIAFAAERPNILWLSLEDQTPYFGCYGDPQAITPHVDQLAEEGVRYTQAFTTAGVCAPCRSGIITGMYQTTIGTHHMRCTATLPEFIQPFPKYLREAGYYCTNNSKQDYQFRTPPGVWDVSSGKAHWKNRPDPQQPFFAVFNYTGCHESGVANQRKYEQATKGLTVEQRQNPNELTLPPYYPDTPIVREDWKRNYEVITAADRWVGQHLKDLKEAGLDENTIVMFWTDHGTGLPRAKRWLYDSGTHIPLIVRIPEAFRVGDQGEPGSVSDRLVSSIDFGATVLNLAGVTIPEYMQGQAFLGANLPTAREYVFGARDRMDERYDIIRMVRDQRFKYIRNYEPLKPGYQYINTAEKGATMQELRRLHEKGQLLPAADFCFQPVKPVEELYDCQKDPHEIQNLAQDPAYADVLQRMRKVHRRWVVETRDLGLIPEPIIEERRRELGEEYAILRQADAEAVATRLENIANLASQGEAALPDLLEALTSKDSAVRYWAATGLGNIGPAAREASADAISNMLQDSSSAVRSAAARAVCRMGLPDEDALAVLIQELTQGTQWERLHAAIVLDELDEQARPVIEQLRQGLQYQKGFNSDGKYRVRVTNRALNELEGTSNVVP